MFMSSEHLRSILIYAGTWISMVLFQKMMIIQNFEAWKSSGQNKTRN